MPARIKLRQRQGRWTLLLLSVGWLAACGQNPVQRVTAPFNPAQARAMLQPGHNEIDGSAVLWLSSGGVISCAGEGVTLYPATRYAAEWARLTYDSVERDNASPPNFAYRPKSAGPVNLSVDPGFLDHNRSASCDADGNFHFENVGDGEFYVVARIAWQQHIWDEHNFFHGNQYHNREGTVMRKVRVQAGQKATVDLKWSVPNTRFNF